MILPMGPFVSLFVDSFDGVLRGDKCMPLSVGTIIAKRPLS